MRTRLILLLALILAGAVVASVLGGSMIWVLGGATGLDVRGVAMRTDRPAERVPVGFGWTHYGGDAGGHRYSRADQITTDNIDRLAPVWEYRTGDLIAKADHMSSAATEGTPILAGDSLVFCTPFNEVVALHPGTGAERWRFDPKIDLHQQPANQFVCRGVAYWRAETSTGLCAERIFMGTNDARLIALDLATGRRCPSFGEDGEVRIDPGMALVWPGEFQITSPPVTVGDTLVVGSSIGDNARVVAPRGSLRAFDASTGAPRWDWDPIPRSEDKPAASSWQGEQPPNEGHANVWAPMAVDEQRGLVIVPTSSPSPDFYGGLRPGDNRHANSVVALDGETGQIRWSFQTVHHDVWDYDLPAQPGLYSVWRDGQLHDIVAQVTKTGFVFVLLRDTGAPFLPIEERPVNQDGAAGEALSATQPFPVQTPPLVPNHLSPDEAFGLTWFDRQVCRRQIEDARTGGLFTPPSEQGTLLYPFTGGGANWGSAAFDPGRNLLLINMNNLAHHIQLIPSEKVDEMRRVFHDQEVSPQTGAPFGVKRELLLSPLGIPCTPPPWGILAAVDLASGGIVWRKPIGEMYGVALGAPNLGGAIVTAGGLVFIAATIDGYLRALDVETGDELWRFKLPTAAQATPMTYVWNDRQYLVIYAGGNPRSGTRVFDRLVAFAIDEPNGRKHAVMELTPERNES